MDRKIMKSGSSILSLHRQVHGTLEPQRNGPK